MHVLGDSYIQANFQYDYSHVWRNLGIVIAFWLFFVALYLIATELHSSVSSKADVLLFLRKHGADGIQKTAVHVSNLDGRLDLPKARDVRNSNQAQEIKFIEAQRSVFTWRDLVYDIQIKDETHRLLDHVSGWVKPGTLTALMGVSGAGKTTLLDVLAQRTSVGVITGDMLVDGKALDSSFQRRTGAV